MLPEIGASELLVIAIVALIVVGPKDLPMLLRKLGQFMAKLRGMAAEFRASFDEMARQSELDELRKEVEAMRRGQFFEDAGGVTISQEISDIEQSLADVGVNFQPPMGAQHAEFQAQQALDGGGAVQPAKTPRTRKPAVQKAAVKATTAKAAPARKATPPRKRPPSKIVEGG